MTRSWLDDVIDAAARGPVVRAVVIAADGSTPRDVGAWMLISATTTAGTIGGGALEQDVMVRARAMLGDAPAAPWSRHVVRYHLGPELAQCCGGAVRLLLERFGQHEMEQSRALARAEPTLVQRTLLAGGPLCAADAATIVGVGASADVESFCEKVRAPTRPLWLYGAGHVGRAIVYAFAPLPFTITWIDIARNRFPPDVSDDVACVVTPDPAHCVVEAPAAAIHLIMTHSHALDEAIVAAILRRRQFRYLGLIGSATKKARMHQRLARAGLDAGTLARLVCPIGLPGLGGKDPAVIAASVAADLMAQRPVLDVESP